MKQNITLVLISTMLSVLIGCQQHSERALPTEEDHNRFVQVENSSEQPNKDLTNEQIANHLADVAASVPNVHNATAVIAGPYAVVGIDVDKDLDRSRVGTVKYTVSEALRHDPYGKTAIVIADGDIYERIRHMGDKIQQGYPVQGVIDELAGIIARYMPDMPLPKNQPTEPDRNKEILPKHKDDQLDDIQDEQSNHKK